VSEIIIQICADIPDHFAHIYKHVIHTVSMQLDIYCISRIISLLKEAVQNRLYAVIWSLQYKTLLEHWNPKGVKKCPMFYGIWMFTRLPLYSVLSHVSPVTPFYCFFSINFNMILPSMPKFPISFHCNPIQLVRLFMNFKFNSKFWGVHELQFGNHNVRGTLIKCHFLHLF
jgi:hypothetical protein